MTSPSYDLISAGHICLDITPGIPDVHAGRAIEDLFRAGSLLQVDAATIAPGGGAANVGLSAHRLGLSVALMGKYGDDLLGQALLGVLSGVSDDLADGMRLAPGESTSYTIVVAPPGSDRMFLHCPGANDTFSAADVDLDIASTGRLFYFGYPPIMARMYADGGVELAALLAAVRARGVTTALDMALPDPQSQAGEADWRVIFAAALGHVDIFAPSVEELTFMLRRDRYDALIGTGDILDQLEADLLRDLADECLALGVAVVVIKCGRHGLYARSAAAGRITAMGSAAPDPAEWADRELFAPAYRVDRVVSATGAGDSAVAGFLAALLHGEDLPAAADYACVVGAQNVRAVDTTSGVRPWADATAQLGEDRVAAVVDLT